VTEALKAKSLFNIGADTPAEIVEDLDAYCAIFAEPKKDDGKPVCIGCGQVMDGFKQMFGLGVAQEWGLAHGEANCSGCGYPSRGMHYIKDRHGDDLLTIRNVFLQYLPEQDAQRTKGDTA
jgi:hypothetical protein